MPGALVLWLGAAALPAGAQEFEWDKRVENAKKKAIEYLFSKQVNKIRIFTGADGETATDVEADWKDVLIVPNTTAVKIKGKVYEDVHTILPAGWFEKEPPGEGRHITINVGGQSALATLAILQAGVNPKLEPRLAKAVECMMHCHSAQEFKDPRNATRTIKMLMPGLLGTYAIGLRASALEAALTYYKSGDMNTLIRKGLQHDGLQLEGGYTLNAGYDYPMRDPKVAGRWDLSNTQYGILGLWAAARGQVELKDATWRHFNQFLLDIQTREGGWPYGSGNEAGPTANMTAAGIASLFVMLDLVHTKTRGANKPDISPFSHDPLLLRTVQGIERGMDHWGRIWTPNPDGYFLYGTERVGVASGFKYFGAHDWFKEGAEVVLRQQAGDGSWGGGHGPVCQTSWKLLFLVFGGAPILVNKLQYGPKGDWQWNNYPRDAANLVRWFSKEYETLVNWQIINLDPKKEEDLMDAPILYISGYKEIPFTDEEVDILKRYVEKGGTLLCIADGHNPKFVDGIVKLGQRMYPKEKYPEYQFATVTKTHPMFKDIKATDPVTRLPMMHMSNGHRSFAFLVTEDIAHVWHGNKFAGRREAFQLVAILKNYATERATTLPNKIRPGPTHGLPRYSGAARGPVKVGVPAYTTLGKVPMQFPGDRAPKPVAAQSDWNSAPVAWRAFSVWSSHSAGFEVQDVRGIAFSDPDLNSYDVLHLTGHYPFTLSAEEKDHLKKYVQGGGSVLIDCVGGTSTDFFTSARDLMRELFGRDAVIDMPRNHPVMTGSLDGARLVEDVSGGDPSRQLKVLRPNLTGPSEVLKGVVVDGRLAVLMSPYDLSQAMAGQTNWERLGFSTKTTRGLVGNFLMYAKTAPRGKPVAGAAK
jgi:hypothetical protein